MSIFVDIQKAHSIQNVPSHSLLIDWAEMALADYREDVVLSVRICDEHEGKELNSKFRKKSKASNVLSFPFENPIGVPKGEVANYLGDIVICAPIVEKEAIEQSKNNIAHWAHLLIHGILHLRGFTHVNEDDAKEMENIERDLLLKMGFPDPYKL